MARRERNIYKRKDGRYEARYIKSRDNNGKAVYGAVYARNYAEVKDKLARAKASLKMAKQPHSKQTVTAELAVHLDSLKNQIKPSTYGIYQGYIERYISPFFGDTLCKKLTTEVLQGFADKLIENGLSVSTVQSVFSFLRCGLKNVFAKEFFDIKIPKKSTAEAEVLSLGEQKRLEIAAKTSGDIDRFAVTLCLYTGLRIGELCGLLWTDIDFERQLLHVRRTVQRIKNPDYKGDSRDCPKTIVACLTPKSVASLRSIPLPEFLIEFLSDYRSDSGLVISGDSKFIEPRNLQYRFQRLLISAGVKKINFHALRHTFSVRALESGFDVKALSEILGHASAMVTLKKYAHALDEHKRRSMESLSAVYY